MLNKVKSASGGNTQTITFKVDDMHCESCPKLIKITLLELDGIIDVSASLENKTVVVIFDSQITSVPKIINSIKEIGYTASIK